MNRAQAKTAVLNHYKLTTFIDSRGCEVDVLYKGKYVSALDLVYLVQHGAKLPNREPISKLAYRKLMEKVDKAKEENKALPFAYMSYEQFQSNYDQLKRYL